MLGSPLNSAKYALKGLFLLGTPGLRRYVWAPLLINLVLFSLAFWTASYFFAELIEWLIPSWLDWLRWLLWPIFAITLLLVFLFSFTLVANLIACPFYGRLASKTKQIVIGSESAQTEEIISAGILPSIASELKRVLYFLSRGLPILVLLIIPGVNIIGSILWLAFSAWFLALEYMAYSLELRGLMFPQQLHLLKKKRWSAITFGGMVMLGLAVPVFNLLVPAAAVIGATVYIANITVD